MTYAPTCTLMENQEERAPTCTPTENQEERGFAGQVIKY